MELNYDKSEWDKIPDSVRQLDSEELDFTDHSMRNLHKLEMDRRLFAMSNFLPEYKWDGTERDRYEDDDDDSGTIKPGDKPSQPGLTEFINSV